MPKLNMDLLFEDPEQLDPQALPDYTTLDFVSGGNHLYGEIMWPTANLKEPRPCVIMLHGFPGSARNDDISHALCRMGCVVLVPHHRGAWGSQGKYLISNCIDDAKNLAEHAHSEDFVRQYNVDSSAIYLLGHSMGATSALNAGRQLPWVKGIIMLTPYDPTRYLNGDKEAYFHSLLQEGKILQSDGIDAIYEDVVQHKEQISHANAFEQVKERNLLAFAAIHDSVSPLEEMVYPLWRQIEAYRSQRAGIAVQRCIELPTEHGLLGRRIAVIREIGKFICETAPQEI
ncbi:MAG: alpha/beta hydrolase [Paludibacteraceae bacterium]|nr:alpha/beta hydrolase [Paludibacteraceae bacterium]